MCNICIEKKKGLTSVILGSILIIAYPTSVCNKVKDIYGQSNEWVFIILTLVSKVGTILLHVFSSVALAFIVITIIGQKSLGHSGHENAQGYKFKPVTGGFLMSG